MKGSYLIARSLSELNYDNQEPVRHCEICGRLAVCTYTQNDDMSEAVGDPWFEWVCCDCIEEKA